MKGRSSVYPLIEFRDAEKNDFIKIIDGDRGVNYPKKEEMRSEGYCLFLNTGNIIDDRFILDSADYISEEKDAKLRQGKLARKDVVLTTRGTVGSVAHYNQRIKQQNIRINSGMVILRTSQKLNDLFFYNIMKSDFLKQQFYLFSSGSAQPQLPIKDLRRIKIPVPSIQLQKKIAAILSTYDDLIENNNRRISILEKMAEELYREWFVRFRFPGHEKVKITKGVPEGWSIKELKDVAQESSKSTKAGAHLSDRYYLPIDLLNQKGFLPSGHLDHSEAQSSLVLFQKRDILFGAMRPYLHKICLAPFNGITRTTCFVIQPIDEKFYSWLYLLLFQSTTIEYATLICNGADRPYAVWNKGFERMKILKPSEEIAAKFNEKVLPILNYTLMRYFLLQNLKTTRDHLLSRLMSGKIDVENMDIQFPASMQEEAVHA